MRRRTSTSPTRSSRRWWPLKQGPEGGVLQASHQCLPANAVRPNVELPDVDDSRFTYRVGLNYEPDEDLLFFRTYSTGYKSAGYNSGAGPSYEIPSPPPTPATWIPARTARLRSRDQGSWELGAKTSWLDRKLTLNLTFYRMNIKGFQDRAFDGTSFTVRNAGNLRHQGFEFDGIAGRCRTCRSSPTRHTWTPSSPTIRRHPACLARRPFPGPEGQTRDFAPEVERAPGCGLDR